MNWLPRQSRLHRLRRNARRAAISILSLTGDATMPSASRRLITFHVAPCVRTLARRVGSHHVANSARNATRGHTVACTPHSAVGVAQQIHHSSAMSLCNLRQTVLCLLARSHHVARRLRTAPRRRTLRSTCQVPSNATRGHTVAHGVSANVAYTCSYVDVRIGTSGRIGKIGGRGNRRAIRHTYFL